MKKQHIKKIIIDTDPGHDDVLALLLAIQSQLFDIQAITTVCGNSTIENTTRNAQYVLDLVHKKIPLHSGASHPLSRELVQAVVHGQSGLEGIDPANDFVLTQDASDQIVRIANELGPELTIITLGPLTNIAEAFQKDPKAMNSVQEIVMMGGAVRVPGNKNSVAEFNMFVDPEAAEIVFKSSVHKVLIPLDACNHVRLQYEDFELIRNPIVRTEILKMVSPYIENIYYDEGVKAALMYDPLTVFHVLRPEYSQQEELHIQLETQGEITRGMTVADLRKRPKYKPNCTVVSFIEEEAFREYFIRTLSKSI